MILKNILLALLILCPIVSSAKMKNGADQTEKLIPLLQGKNVALIVNHTSTTRNGTHILDTLLTSGVNIKLIFAPEHGFRGTADAGEKVQDSRDAKTGLPIVSLYGKNRKPQTEQLKGIDVVVFDIQDVGARFYTYISTLYYAMQKCAEMNKEFIVLDRPNPNDHVAGPILKDSLKSFVGALPLPVQHGLTVGELAKMIVGEGWLKNKTMKLSIIPVTEWKHGQPYSLPIKPSPNLPNDKAIALYPSLCFFEATDVSVGRGTYFPFQVVGFPQNKFGKFSFTPQPLDGYDKNPLQNGKKCYGLDLRNTPTDGKLTLKYFIDFYNLSDNKERFISRVSFFDLLMGDIATRHDILAGKSSSEIEKRWEKELKIYKDTRKKYLLYTDYYNGQK